MVDLKPPRFAGDELATVHALLQFQRESLVRKVTGVSKADAVKSPVGSGTSLLWIIQHISSGERNWVLGRFAGIDAGAAQESDTLEAAVEFYRQTWSDVDEIVFDSPTLDEAAQNVDPGSPPVNLRWVLMHLLEETARHAGHADILRELIDGSTGR